MNLQRHSRLLCFTQYALVGLSALTAVWGLLGCSQGGATQNKALSAMPVKTEVAQVSVVPDTSEYLASLKSRHSANIDPQVEGWIVKIDVRSGEHVHEGAPLMEIDPRVQQASVKSQEASRAAQAATLANAKAQYQRAQQLYKDGLISSQDFDTYESTYNSAVGQLNAAEAQVSQQQAQLHYYEVTAPTDGIVGDIPVHVGDRVTNTTLLTTVDQPGALEAYISVPVEHSQDLRIGEPVDLLDDSDNVIAHCSIFFVSPQVGTSSQTVLAKAEIPNAGDKFRNDELVNVRITWRTRKGLLLPVLAVSRINGQFFVFIAEQGPNGTVARQQQIQVGNIIGNNYVVQSGIKAGDHVIVAGFQFLVDGMPVKETIENAASQAAAN